MTCHSKVLTQPKSYLPYRHISTENVKAVDKVPRVTEVLQSEKEYSEEMAALAILLNESIQTWYKK